jgi:hypothetical protein
MITIGVDAHKRVHAAVAVDAAGLYDLDHRLRPVGEQYRKLIAQWSQVLPSGSTALMLV